MRRAHDQGLVRSCHLVATPLCWYQYMEMIHYESVLMLSYLDTKRYVVHLAPFVWWFIKYKAATRRTGSGDQVQIARAALNKIIQRTTLKHFSIRRAPGPPWATVGQMTPGGVRALSPPLLDVP